MDGSRRLLNSIRPGLFLSTLSRSAAELAPRTELALAVFAGPGETAEARQFVHGNGFLGHDGYCKTCLQVSQLEDKQFPHKWEVQSDYRTE
jgi:hypothetical protein